MSSVELKKETVIYAVVDKEDMTQCSFGCGHYDGVMCRQFNEALDEMAEMSRCGDCIDEFGFGDETKAGICHSCDVWTRFDPNDLKEDEMPKCRECGEDCDRIYG